MKNKTLLIANFKRHKGTMMGIFIIMATACLTFISVLTIWINTNTYLEEEVTRMRYGDLTVWTQGIQYPKQIQTEIEQMNEVESVSLQRLIYSDYKIREEESDSEGQLLVYEPKAYPYRIFNDTNNDYKGQTSSLNKGEIYISPSLLSMFNIAIGDEIDFTIARFGNSRTFKVKGTFEDPFMGSSMIGMKSFLITEQDYEEISLMIEQAGIDALARTGQMYHIVQDEQSSLNNVQLNQLINEHSNLEMYTEFVHSKEAITGFMLLLQNVFTALFLIFALVLLVVSMIMISYSIASSIEIDYKDMAILKTVGYDGKQLRSNLKIQYLAILMLGMLTGMMLSISTVPIISSIMVEFSGILTPFTPHIDLWVICILMMFILFYSFIHIKTRRINTIHPLAIIKEEESDFYDTKKAVIKLHKRWLLTRISLRQLMSAKRRYVSVLISAILLVCFTSMIGRMNTWLGPDGKGLMDAFHPADLDIGVQLVGNQDVNDVVKIIQQSTTITDYYALAMPSVIVDGVDYTANIITEPERFHIREGTTSREVDEIVITNTIAIDRNLSINDRVIVTYHGKSASYRISGIYQCANDMGGNIGMNKEGFQRIGNDTSDLWCHHYFLGEDEYKENITDELNKVFGGDVYIHENTWPGLFSVISAMQVLIILMYVITGIFILIVTILTMNKFFLTEKRNLSIYKSLGYTTRQLRTTFAIRYGIVAMLGSVIGIMMSVLVTDYAIGNLMALYGISNFTSHPGIFSILLPGCIVSILFALFAYLSSKKLKSLDLHELITE